MPGDSPVVDSSRSWSHGISFDNFTSLVQRHAATVSISVPHSTTASASLLSTAVAVPEIHPEPPSTQDPLPTAGPMKTTLGAAVPADIRRWEPSIVKYARQNGIDPNLVAAMMMTESQGNPVAMSSRGAVGLMQVVDGPYDPEANIALGATIIAANLRRYSGNVELSLAAYNAGAGAVDQFRGVPPYLETETYVYVVLNRYYLYQPDGT
jgi:hypothetical protein